MQTKIVVYFLNFRGIYAASKLTREQQEHLAVLNEEGMFCVVEPWSPKITFFMELFSLSQMRPVQHLW